MKKIITFLLLALCLVAVEEANAQTAIMLKNGNKATIYEKETLAKVIEAAADGDTILLTTGEFTGDITINKKISIIGAGQGSIIAGNVTFKMSDNTTLNSRLLDGLKITKNLTIDSSVNGLNIRKIYMENFTATTLNDAMLDRCYINNIFTVNSTVYAKVINSYIRYTYYDCKNVTFINCYITCINRCGGSNNNFGAIAINSVIRTYYTYMGNSYKDIASSCHLINCMICSDLNIQNAVRENCYILSGKEIDNLDLSQTDNLISTGYIGTDGTAIGRYGGQTPFTLVPSGPKITNIELKVDPTSNKLKVTATGKVN